MLRANRNAERDKKANAPRVDKNGSRNQDDIRNHGNARDRDSASVRRSEWEWQRMDNDLYERQSI